MSRSGQKLPPAFAQRLLQWFIKDELAEEVLGDLDEKFYQTLESKTMLRAKLNYWYQVINYLRPFAIKVYRSHSNFNNMYLHNFKISFRSLNKNKGYSFLNVLGLTLGLSIAMLIGLWINDELSFNKSFSHYDRIAKIMVQYHSPQEDISTTSIMPPGLGTYLKDNFPGQFEQVAIARSRPEDIILGNGSAQFTAIGLFIQQSGPIIFDLEMIAGKQDGLTDINTILLSKQLATKLFGRSDVVGESVKYNGDRELSVAGVYETLPANSFLNGNEFIAPFELYINGWSDVTVWDNYFTEVFVKLTPQTKTQQASKMIEELLSPHVEGVESRLLFVEPMKNWHLFGEFENGERVTSQRMKFVNLFALVGIFVLGLACINFINLSTARSEKRAKEIGIRKSIGSGKHQLIHQFLTEALLISYVSFLIAIIVVSAGILLFNQIAGKNISIPLGDWWFWICGIAIATMSGLFAGSYPAFYLSSINPVKSLKGTYKLGNQGSLPRKSLVVFQFTISIVLLIGTLIFYSQVNYVKTRPVGYDKNHLIMMQKRTSDLYGKYDAFNAQFSNSGVVQAIGEASYPLDNTLGNNADFQWEGKSPNFNPVFNTVKVNYDYGSVVQWELIEGRNFSRDYPGDVRNAVIITESAKKIMGFDQAVGQQLKFNNKNYSEPRVTIVGVVKDMIKGNPFESTKPAIMFLSNEPLPWMFIRLNEKAKIAESLIAVERVIKDIAPSSPFDYTFVDEAYDAKFRSEERIGSLITVFTLLAIVISCLGVFGLANYMAERRTKEIGIRKTLGASTFSLWHLLSKDFVFLVIAACLLAGPLAYYFLDGWLDNFDYRVNITWWFFIFSGVGTLIITLLTISYKTINAALANPVKSLRSE